MFLWSLRPGRITAPADARAPFSCADSPIPETILAGAGARQAGDAGGEIGEAL